MLARRLLLPFLLPAVLPTVQGERVLDAARFEIGAETARVIVIQPAGEADLILLNRGHAHGYRRGMRCAVSRDGRFLAEIELIELRTHAAAALITRLAAPGEALRPGDHVALQLSSS
jgi:hypothetical protein